MGWADRKYEDRGGGGMGDALRRVFESSNPLDWSLPLYTAWGIRVRIHLIYLAFIITELITSILARDRMGLPYTALAMGSLFLLVLLHEYGHCFTCRWVGGTADRILMWPLGGLAYCLPPHHWKPSLLTTLGGPAVNVVLVPVFGLPLLLLSGWNAVVFNPFSPGLAWQWVGLSDGSQPYWLFVLWSFYLTNLALLSFNMLLPMYPMDAGRVLQELLWRKLGYHRATSIAATVGLALAAVLLVVAMATRQMTLLGVALFCGIICWQEKGRLAATAGEWEVPGYDFSRGHKGLPQEEPVDTRAAEKRRERERTEQQRLDAILAKIASSGMASLSRGERSWLRRATEKRRRG